MIGARKRKIAELELKIEALEGSKKQAFQISKVLVIVVGLLLVVILLKQMNSSNGRIFITDD